MRPNRTFTEEILNGKVNLLCSVRAAWKDIDQVATLIKISI